MKTVVVVSNRKDWPFRLPGVEVVEARRYLTDSSYAESRGLRVFNLSRSYRYQSAGYYVSLLASARGHKPVPSIETIQDMKASEIVRIRSDELDDLVQRSLRPLSKNEFTLSIYFGKNIAARYDRLAAHLTKLFHAPLLRAKFSRSNGRWQLVRVRPISAGDIPEQHRDFVLDAAAEYFQNTKRQRSASRSSRHAYDLAILFDPDEVEPPSDERALRKFMRAARRYGMDPQLVGRDDYARLAEFDALFIRETTNVNHHTYRFARRAYAKDLVVVDDPESIVRCTNKIYLAELLKRHNVATPRTLVVGRDSVSRISQELSFPCVLKKPDSAFSQGVVKVNDDEALEAEAERLFGKGELIVAQEFMPTDFDWRVGIFDGVPLYACRYYMARRHWQIIQNLNSGQRRSGRVDTIAVEEAPRRVVQTALKAAALIGNGLYGVDLKQVGRRVVVVEVNDNPSIDAGYEDAFLGDTLYDRIMAVFARRLESQRRGAAA